MFEYGALAADRFSPLDQLSSWNEHTLFRRFMTDAYEGEAGIIEIRLAVSLQDKAQARTLLNRMYASRGYGEDHNLSDQPGSATFLVLADGVAVGTLTLTVDSAPPSGPGMGIDATFPEELALHRARAGSSLCELTRFAIDWSRHSKPLLAALFHVIFTYGTQRHNCTDLFIEVNPRHVRFYEVMLGFARVGMMKTNSSVSAPSQLMRLTVADIGRYIRIYAGQDRNAGHSLYPYFFSAADEQALRERIMGLPADGDIAAMYPGHEDVATIMRDPEDFREAVAA